MDSLLQTICDAADGTGLMRHVGEFGKWVKLSGTDGEMASLRYIQSELDAYGFGTRILQHDAYISLPGKSRVLVDGQSLASITHSFSCPSPAGGLSARLVYAGSGSDADFAGKDVRGAIVLVDGIATPPVARRASLAGAAGQLHVSPHEHLHEMCISPVWGNPSAETRKDLPTAVVCSVLPSAGLPLRERLARGDQPEIVLHAEVETGWRKTPILVAELDPPVAIEDAPFVLFSGHHDTWYYGVMDNGSANAAMLEVARICGHRREHWRRGLRICFWSGHSHGRYSGSTWYVDEHWSELDQRCVAHVNVDSLGARGADQLENVGSMSELGALAAEAIEAHSGQRLAGKRMSRGADQSFNGVGLPAMFGDLSEPLPTPVGPHCWWWHTPDDLADKIDEANLVRDTRIYVHAIWRLLTDRLLPLDYAATARALLAELETLRIALAERLPLDTLTQATQALHGNAVALSAHSPGATGHDVERINRALMKVSRALVPLSYTSGDRFAHDPALAQPPWPVLRELAAFAAADPGSDAGRFLAAGATRARNRMLHGVREANAALRAVLAQDG
jgi:hypothetical protein